MAAVRRQAVLHYAMPRFLSDWINRPAMLPLTMLIPAILLVVALLLKDPLGSAFGFVHHEGEGMEYANLFPHWLLIGFFTFFLGLAVFLGVLGIVRFWKAMEAADSASTPKGSVITSLTRAVTDVFIHSRFNLCTSNSSGRTAHLTAFYGFLVLFLVSGWAVILLYILNPFLPSNPFIYPFPFWNPAKIIANLGAVALVTGALIAIRERLNNGLEIGKSSDFDWLFLWTILAVGLTGILTEGMRFAELELIGYVIYFIHLVLAFMLLTYLPYSKFAHIFYRTAAIVYAEHTGRTPHSAQRQKS